MARRYCYKDVLPFTAMVAVECGYVGVNILFKVAASKGMSYYIFITYCSAIAALLLLPLYFIFYRRAVLPPLKFHLVSRICLLGLIGFSSQICLYKGIEYSSPTLASAVGNLSPAFTFILAVLFGFSSFFDLLSVDSAMLVTFLSSIIIFLYPYEFHSNYQLKSFC